MSIVPQIRVTIVAAAADREAVVAQLQALGTLQLDVHGPDVPLAIDTDLDTAIGWLATAPQQRHPERRAELADAAALVRATLAARSRGQALAEERAQLCKRIADVRPWGRFRFRELTSHPQLRMWFYRLATEELAHLDGQVFAEVARSGAQHMVVVLAETEPMLAIPRIHVGARTLDALEARLADVDVALDDVAAERVALTRWLPLLRAERNRLADAAARSHAVGALPVEGPLAILGGWIPSPHLAELADWAAGAGVALLCRPPAPQDTPPTLLANPPAAAPGEALVRFFTTPDYRAWDPSAAVMFSFILFFAIIVSDAVYGLALGVLLALFWRRLGRSGDGRRARQLCAWLALATMGWGVLAGTYAGAPPPNALAARLQLVPVNDLEAMLKLSVGIGIAHLALANALAAARLKPERTALARLGWIAILLATPVAALLPALRLPALLVAGAGLVAVLLWSSSRRDPIARVIDGAGAAARLVSALGDTLSYLRLFALALAGSALAAAFNALAGDAFRVPGAGVVLGLMVLVLGHGLNLLLSVASGFVHGLRLNYIEFLGWGLWGEGRPFHPFRMSG